MVDDVERLVLQMSADMRGFEREMGRTRQITERRLREAEQRVDDLRTSMGGAKDALAAYEEAAKAAANATGENAARMQQSAEAARIDALYRLENARAIREQTAALAEQRAREARAADQAASRGGTPYPGMLGGQAVQANQRSIQAQREADAARDAERAASARYDRIGRNVRSGAYRGSPVAVAPVRARPARAAGSAGPSAADLEARHTPNDPERCRIGGEIVAHSLTVDADGRVAMGSQIIDWFDDREDDYSKAAAILPGFAKVEGGVVW
ncbi:hypothetical protein [uncultured Brevundimonas sp.]|uniref:hypothetical protein n=1 Tax=uncultured Brevundimonas sp. TaxID=213418 RepID=UPI0025CF25B3|nr:hypothetical protein [uncultured Brevundimonas sp.]